MRTISVAIAHLALWTAVAAAQDAPTEKAGKPSAASRTRLAGLYWQLADLEGYLDRMNKLTEDDDWPDWAPEASAIDDQRHRLYTIDQRRHRPDETLRKRMDELFGPRRDGRWWSLKPAPQWLDLEGPVD